MKLKSSGLHNEEMLLINLPSELQSVPIQLFHFRYDTDIAALSIGRYRYRSDAISAGIIHTFITYFVVWNVRKGLIK